MMDDWKEIFNGRPEGITNELDAYRYLRQSAHQQSLRAGILPGHTHPIHGHSIGGPSPLEIARKLRDRAMGILAFRLRLDEGQSFGFEFIELHLGQEKAILFIVKNGSPVTLEDDINLFPSDALVASVRLLIG